MSGGRVKINSKFSKRLKFDYALFDLIGVRTGYLSMKRELFKTGGQGIKIRMFDSSFSPKLRSQLHIVRLRSELKFIRLLLVKFKTF